MTTYDSLKQNGEDVAAINTVFDAAEANIHTLDSSVVDFILDVDNQLGDSMRSGVTPRVRASALAYLLLAVFDTPEDIINIVVNDERWQKWDNLEVFAKCYEGRAFPVITNYFGHILITEKGLVKNPDGKEFMFPDDDLPIDYCTMINNKPYQKKCGIVSGSADLKELSEYQINNFYTALYKMEDPSWGDSLSNNKLLNTAVRLQGKNNKGLYEVYSCKTVDHGMYIPLTKIDYAASSNAWLETIIPKSIIDKYGMTILED